MSDIFNIESVGTINNSNIAEDISLISQIIKQIIACPFRELDGHHKITKPYSIEDKIKKNSLSSTNRTMIIESHIHYSEIDQALNCIGETDLLVKEELIEFFRNAYLRVLIRHEIDIDNLDEIKSNSDTIFTEIIDSVFHDVYDYTNPNLPIERRILYVKYISVYVFYLCRILIPME